MKTYICTVSNKFLENYQIGIQAGLWGVEEKYKNKILKVQQGDLLVFIVSGVYKTLHQIESQVFTDKTPLWPKKDGSIFPYRIKISKPIKNSNQPAKSLASKISFMKGKFWGGTIQGAAGVFNDKLNNNDVKLIFGKEVAPLLKAKPSQPKKIKLEKPKKSSGLPVFENNAENTVENLTDEQSYIKNRLEELRKKLVDVSGRTNLISFRHSERVHSHVRIIDEIPDQLLERIKTSKGMTFIPLPDQENAPKDEKTPEFQDAYAYIKIEDEYFISEFKKLVDGDISEDSPKYLTLDRELKDKAREFLDMSVLPNRHTMSKDEYATLKGFIPNYELPKPDPKDRSKAHSDDNIQTLLFDDELNRKLNGLYKKAKLFEQEYGINVLYIAYGFLTWADSDHSNKTFDSPLLLLQIDITKVKRGKKYQYKISSAGEDIIVNLALEDRLRKDFAIALPDFSEKDNLENYFSKLDKLFKERTGWKVNRYVTTGVFNFSKIALWNDLKSENWGKTELLDNPTISNLLYGNIDDNSDIEEAEVYDIDSEEIQNKLSATFLDADSSQYSAIVDALSGKNLVIQGPPGTGKSQTISNMIACLLAQDKNVLFVAEKQVALEVVYKRLKQIGLSKFILPIHGRRAKRKEVTDALADRLKTSDEVRSDFNSTFNRLNKQKDELVEYRNTINQQIGESGLTLHDIHWKHIKLKDALKESDGFSSLESLQIERPFKISKNVYLERRQLIEQYQECYVEASMDDPDTRNPWSFICNAELTVPELGQVKSITAQVGEKISQVCKEFSEHVYLLSSSANELKTGRLLLSDIVKNIDTVFHPLMKNLASSDDREKMKEFLNNLDELFKIKSEVHSTFTDQSIESTLLTKLYEKLQALNSDPIFNKIPDENLDFFINTIDKIIENYKNLKSQLSDHKKINNFIKKKSKIDFNNPKTVIALFNICEVAKEYEDDVIINKTEALFDQKNWDKIKSAKNICIKLRSLKAELEKTCDLDIELDIKKLTKELPSYLSANIIEKTFRMTEIDKALKIIINNKPKFPKYHSHEERTKIIKKYLEYKKGEEKINSDDSLKDILGDNFKELDTDFDLIDQIIKLRTDIGNRVPLSNEESLSAFNLFLNGKFDEVKSIIDLLNEKKTVDLFKNLKSVLVRQPFIEYKKVGEFESDLTQTVKVLSDFEKLVKPHNFYEHCNFSDLVKAIELFIEVSDKSEAIDEFVDSLYINDDYGLDPLFNIDEVNNAIELSETISNTDIPKAFKDTLYNFDYKNDLPALNKLISTSKVFESKEFNKDFERFIELSNPMVSFFSESRFYDAFFDIPIKELGHAFQAASNNEDQLTSMFNYIKIENKLFLINLNEFVLKCAIEYPNEIDRLVEKFDYLYFNSLILEAYHRYPSLNNYNGIKLNSLTSEFIKLDMQLMEANCGSLIKKLFSDHIPSGVGKGLKSEYTDLSLIRHELTKKRMHIPTRALIKRAGKAISQMKPCFMMSPFTVAKHLPQSNILFDVVIIDEASQMKPEDALGAIARGSQFIVVGDPKQLPPTSFFQRMEREDDDFENEEQVLAESILDLALSQFRNKRNLLWHYRSRHESLINFSNTKFYNNDLIIFPSPKGDSGSYGVQHKFVEDGLFKGSSSKSSTKKGSSGFNENEAEEVINTAIELMISYPKKSIGIATLNKAQQERIEDKLQLVMATNGKVRDYLDSFDGKIDEFFIKNLENVQGDERDIIIISTVYGPDYALKTNDDKRHVYNRFGPINHPGGERRLNVLFTRAKESVHLITSLKPSDITSTNLGSNTLKSYLEYADTGKIESGYIETGREPDSDFEVFVANALRDHGYKVVPQLGVAGYFIDIAVKHPDNDGFLCAVECDGASYHSGHSARDRDRLRQSVLENLDWNFYRIWSTDWFTDTANQKTRLVKHLESLRNA